MIFFKNLKEYSGIKPGLLRIKKFLNDVDNPQDSLKFVHIAGTNGKGSTAVFVSEVLKSAGYKAALYTSPHLINVNERISINGKNILKETFKDLSRKYIDKARKYKLSYFEYLTSLAFIYFALAKVDVAIIETGLGGRFDATNVIRRPLACVITSIAKDHQELLGNTIEDIAFEKAGIIKNGCDVVCGKLPQKAEAIISRKSIPYVYGKNFESSNISITRAPSQKFDYKSKSLNLRDIEINMLGLHQVVNASVAVCVLELLSKKGFLVSQAAIKQGLKNSLWPGRFDIRNLIIDDKSFKIIIDGSHNIEGFNAFFDTFNKLGFAKEKRTFIFASMKEKEYEQMAKKIVPFAKRVILPYIKNDRAVNPIDLKEEFSKYISDEKLFIANSVDKALRMFDDGEIGLTIGSLYLAGEVLTTVQKYNARRSQCQKVYI